MAVETLAVALALVPLAALATYTPWPVPAGVLLVSAGVGVLVALGTQEAFLGTCVGVACATAAFTFGTAGQVFGAVAGGREPRRSRSPRRRARPRPRPRPQPLVEVEPWWVLDQRDRDAA